MRKVMLLAAMLAMVLAAAAPVFAQNTDVVGDENVVANEGDDTQYNAVCQNIIGSIGDITQNQSGNADAVAANNSAAIAEVAQEQGVTQAAVVECVEEGAIEGSVAAAAPVVAQYEATASASASASATAAAAEVLPETGGASLLALGAGALLVAGGLLARRIVR